MDIKRESLDSLTDSSLDTKKPATQPTSDESNSLTNGSKRMKGGGMKNTGKRIF